MEEKILELARLIFESKKPKIGEFDYFLSLASFIFQSGVKKVEVTESVLKKMAKELSIKSFSKEIESLHQDILFVTLENAFWVVGESFKFETLPSPSKEIEVEEFQTKEKESIINNKKIDKKLELDRDFADKLGLSEEFLKELGHE